jgi:hypothetical protein
MAEILLEYRIEMSSRAVATGGLAMTQNMAFGYSR